MKIFENLRSRKARNFWALTFYSFWLYIKYLTDSGANRKRAPKVFVTFDIKFYVSDFA